MVNSIQEVEDPYQTFVDSIKNKSFVIVFDVTFDDYSENDDHRNMILS